MSPEGSTAARTTLLLLALAVVPWMAGCAASSGPLDPVAKEIDLNQAVWEAQRLDDYAYVVRLRCFCIPAALRPVVVEVRDGEVVSRVYRETGEEVETQFEGQFPSVDGLFEVLREAVRTGADDIQVTWDGATGVPLEFFIDYRREVADEELGYEVSELPEPRP